ncbi:hypothetical protein C8Q78DRAFT_962679 [Trametes maxima]|nr:hypothetical protein C8Q78DRAFT_962679 [Trametes maxima]
MARTEQAWPSNHANRRHSVDPRRPWAPSPLVPAADVDIVELPNEEAESSGSSSSRSTRTSGRKQRTRRQAGDEAPVRATPRERPLSWLSCFKLHPRSLFTQDDATVVHAPANTESQNDRAHSDRREITAADWRSYGYWARPRFGGTWDVMVRNATPPPDPARELSLPEVEAIIGSLREAGGERTFPENWVPRARHPCMPPRPEQWPTPQQTYDPLPGELTLNPWLEHRVVGPPALHFDLRLRAEDVQLNRAPAVRYYSDTLSAGNRVDFEYDGPHGAQPATYPGVPRLRITALAEDAQPVFWWPVTVLPHHERLPVLMQDVLDALIANFEEHLTADEFLILSDERKLMLFRAHARRMRMPVGGILPPQDDGLRRVDYLGDNCCFRGLAPAPDGDGFVLFMGPPP